MSLRPRCFCAPQHISASLIVDIILQDPARISDKAAATSGVMGHHPQQSTSHNGHLAKFAEDDFGDLPAV